MMNKDQMANASYEELFNEYERMANRTVAQGYDKRPRWIPASQRSTYEYFMKCFDKMCSTLNLSYHLSGGSIVFHKDKYSNYYMTFTFKYFYDSFQTFINKDIYDDIKTAMSRVETNPEKIREQCDISMNDMFAKIAEAEKRNRDAAEALNTFKKEVGISMMMLKEVEGSSNKGAREIAWRNRREYINNLAVAMMNRWNEDHPLYVGQKITCTLTNSNGYSPESSRRAGEIVAISADGSYGIKTEKGRVITRYKHDITRENSDTWGGSEEYEKYNELRKKMGEVNL